MIEATIKLTVPPEKRKEILQTFKGMLGTIRREKGCLCCSCYEDIETDNLFFFREEWTTQENLNDHLRSTHFGVLLGAMKLLTKEPDIRFNTITFTAGAEAVTAARKR